MNALHIVCDIRDTTVAILCCKQYYSPFIIRRTHYNADDIHCIHNMIKDYDITKVYFVHCFHNNKYIHNRSMINMYTTKACVSCLQIYSERIFTVENYSNVEQTLSEICNVAKSTTILVNKTICGKKYSCITLLLTETFILQHGH